MHRAEVRLYMKDVQDRFIAEADVRRASLRVEAMEVAADLLRSAQSETVKVRLIELLLSDGKSPQVAVNVDARQIAGSAQGVYSYWYGDYYGVLAMGVNKDVIAEAPASFADLVDAKFANAVAMPGDPRTGNSSMLTVYAAGLSGKADAKGADALNAGIAWFKALKESGNLVPVNGSAQNLAQGTTPIYFDWDYNLLAMRDKLAGNPPVDVVIPSDSVLAGVYVQAISAYAPHPNAAKLWMEYIYSDEGQLGWLSGYCHPIRFNAMSAAGKLPAELMAKLPPAEAYAKAVFPSLEDQGAAKEATAANWATEMGAN